MSKAILAPSGTVWCRIGHSDDAAGFISLWHELQTKDRAWCGQTFTECRRTTIDKPLTWCARCRTFRRRLSATPEVA